MVGLRASESESQRDGSEVEGKLGKFKQERLEAKPEADTMFRGAPNARTFLHCRQVLLKACAEGRVNISEDL